MYAVSQDIILPLFILNRNYIYVQFLHEDLYGHCFEALNYDYIAHFGSGSTILICCLDQRATVFFFPVVVIFRGDDNIVERENLIFKFQFSNNKVARYSIFCIKQSALADMHPHPHESAWFWSPGSASGIRIPNADSRCGCGFGLSSVKISAEKRSPILCDKKCKFLKKHFVGFL